MSNPCKSCGKPSRHEFCKTCLDSVPSFLGQQFRYGQPQERDLARDMILAEIKGRKK